MLHAVVISWITSGIGHNAYTMPGIHDKSVTKTQKGVSVSYAPAQIAVWSFPQKKCWISSKDVQILSWYFAWSDCHERIWQNPVKSTVCKQQARCFYLSAHIIGQAIPVSKWFVSFFGRIELCLDFFVNSCIHSIRKQAQIFFLNIQCCNIIVLTVWLWIIRPAKESVNLLRASFQS